MKNTNTTEETISKIDRNIRAIKELLIIAFLSTSLLLIDIYAFNGKYILFNATEIENRQAENYKASNNMNNEEMNNEDEMPIDNVATVNNQSTPENNSPVINNKSVTYKSKKGVELNVTYNKDKVQISSNKRLQLKEITLTQSISASGAKYISQDSELEL